MYSFMIVDDEKKERSIIKLFIERYYPEVFQVIEASNGIAALELMKEVNPDLIFMDIQMPGLSGIETIKEIRKENRKAFIVILSAFNYFEYAKEAIREGVNDYLLKPLARHDFITEIQSFFDFIQNVNKDEEIHNEYKTIIEQNLVTALAFNSFNAEKLNNYFDILKIDFKWTICVLIKNINNLIPSEIMDMMRKEVLNQFTDDPFHIISNVINGNFTLFVLFGESISLSEKLIKHKLQQIQKERHPNVEFGISGVYLKKEQYHQAYDEALTNLIALKSTINQPRDVNEIEIQMSKSIRENNPKETYDLLEGFINALEYADFTTNEMKTNLVELITSVTRNVLPYKLQDAYISEFSTILGTNSSTEMMTNSKNYIATLIETVRKEALYITHHVIDRAKKYVKENYHKDITVNFLAEKFSLNPFYFSVLFKKHENQNFSAFLTNIRIENAIRLMKETEKSIKQISFEVGYQDQNYFSKVFKKRMGTGPKEYRKRLNNS